MFNLLLQVLDEGYLTDSLGRKIDFRNTIIIMTSNIGSRHLKDFGTGVGFATTNKVQNTEKDSKHIIESALKKFFSPEFLNRIDDVIVFKSLEKDDIIKILDVTMVKMLKRINELGISIELDMKAKEFLANKGFDADFGARPLQRALQKYLEDPLAEEILKGEAQNNSVLSVSVAPDGESLAISKVNPQTDSLAEENDA